MRMTSSIYFVIYIIICSERVHTGSDLNQRHDNYTKRDSRVHSVDNQEFIKVWLENPELERTYNRILLSW